MSSAPRRILGYYTLGKEHEYWSPYGSYRVSITNTQAKKLFGRDDALPDPIDCGTFACVFPHRDPNKIVKLTRDDTDVASMEAARKSPYAPKLHELYTLDSETAWTSPPTLTGRLKHPLPAEHSHHGMSPPVYAMVVEKMRTIPKRYQDWLSNRAKCAREKIGKVLSRNKVYGKWGFTKEQVKDLWACCPTVKAKLPKAKRTSKRSTAKGDISREPVMVDIQPADPKMINRCRKFVGGLARIADDLYMRGVRWEDMHARNVGFDKAGHMKVLDLGITNVKLEVEPEMLFGRSGARRPRKL